MVGLSVAWCRSSSANKHQFPFTVAPHERRFDALSNVEFRQHPVMWRLK